MKITRSDGTIDDITDNIISQKFSKMVFKEGIGMFDLSLDNNSGTYDDAYGGNEVFNIYMDYSNASVLYFKGKVENIRKQYSEGGKRLLITGSHISHILLDKLITLSKTDTISNIFNYVIDTWFSGYTHNNVETISTNVTINWSNKPALDCFIDLCNLANATGFLNDDNDFYFFTNGAKETNVDAIVSDDNLLDNSGIGSDISNIKNTVTTEGKDKNGLPILYTSSDSTTTLNTKELYIPDTSITSDSMAADKAGAELSINKSASEKGDVISLGLADVKPGYKIWISNPEQNIEAQYTANKIEHTVSDGDFLKASVTVAESIKGISGYFKDRFKRELEKIEILNPNSMKYTYNEAFDSDTGSHSSTQLSGGKLILASGSSNGIWTSASKTLPENVGFFEIRVSGQDLDNSTIEVSTDGGQIYSSVYNLSTQTNQLFTISSGNSIAIKIRLNSATSYPNPFVSSFSVLFKP